MLYSSIPGVASPTTIDMIIPPTLSAFGRKESISSSSEKKTNGEEEGGFANELVYGLEDIPPWYMQLFLGFQHYLEMIGATIACPFILTPALCMDPDDPDKSKIISTLIFLSGIITILQSTLGTRLPIVQGGSFSYLVPTLAILNLPQWKCPPQEVMANMTPEEKTEVWQVRMREIQGAIIFAAIWEVIFAFTGVIGWLTKYITPLTVAPAIMLIGLSLFKNVTEQMSKNYAVAFGTIFLLIIFSQHLKNVKIGAGKFPIFQVFPVLISLAIIWGTCTILTFTNTLPEGDAARVDSKTRILHGSPWFRVPYPFQWGWPTFSLGAGLGVLCGVLTSTIESIGDYIACAQIAKSPPPPTHSLNRGIFIEGFGCVLSGIFGSGNGSTSYSNNIGTISVTKVASRRVIQVAGVIMVVLSLVGKAGAIFIGIPDPILGGMFCFIFPLVMAVGLGTLQEICLESARNLFIICFSLFAGVGLSQYSQANPQLFENLTNSQDLSSVLQILFSTGMFIAGFTGFLLDNTIPGTPKERGLLHNTNKQGEGEKSVILYSPSEDMYDIPQLKYITRKLKFLKWFPISPTYTKHPLEVLVSYFFKRNGEKRKESMMNGGFFAASSKSSSVII